MNLEESGKQKTPIDGDEQAKVAVHDAIEHLSQYKLKLDYTDIAQKALTYSLGATTHRDIVRAIQAIVENKTLIALDKNHSTFTTSGLIEHEKDIMGLVIQGIGSAQPIKLKKKCSPVLI